MKLYIGQQMALPALESVRLGKTRSEAAATLTATVLTAPADTYFLKLSVAVGDPVRLLDDQGKEVFLGSVHEIDRTPEAVTLTAYDRGIYLTRNELYGVYAGTGKAIAGRIAKELGIPLGTVEDDGLRRTIVTGAGQSAFSILRHAVGEGREISIRDGALTVTKGGGKAVLLRLERVLEVNSRASIREMVNRAVVVGRNGRVLTSAQNAGDITAFGQFQQVLGKDGDAGEQAKAALKGRIMSARVTLLGDLSLRCGGTVEVHRPQWGLEGLYTITAHEHRWEKGLFTTSLSLEGINT